MKQSETNKPLKTDLKKINVSLILKNPTKIRSLVWRMLSSVLTVFFIS